jgi:Tol biopolymer transport system component
MVLLDLETSKLTNVTAVERVSRYNANLFFWPGDPKRLGFLAIIDGNMTPFSMDRNGRNKKNLTQGTKGYTYGFEASPDGKHIAYHKSYQVYIAGPQGEHPLQVKTGNPFNFVPRWSRDGQWLLFLSGEHYNCHPFVVRADGTGLRKVGDRQGYSGVMQFLDVVDFHGGSSDCPVWAPDGKRIYYTARFGKGAGAAAVELMQTTVGGKVERLTRSKPGALHYHPTPSPDGRWIAVGSTRADGRRQLFVIPEGQGGSSGGDPRQVTRVPLGWAALHPHWRPSPLR